MDIVKVFGSNLKKYRTALGISQEAFADRCGMHRTYISAIECYRRSISLENIQRIAEALGIETYQLFIENKEDITMTNEIREFRDGIFALRTRRFGTVAELMIEALYSFSKSHNQFHDRYDEVGNQRIEIKFSTVMKANEAVISRFNSIDQCKKANLGNRALSSTEMYDYDFDCNIQQVKRLEFDVLYYGLFFADRIAIFKMYSDEILSCFGYSDKQHKGNEGEGQFHLNRNSIDYHMQNHFVQWLTYEKLYELLNSL